MNRLLGFRSRLVGVGVAIALMIGLAACGGPPKWVKQGSGAFNEKDSKAFYGVGSVTGVQERAAGLGHRRKSCQSGNRQDL